MSRLVFALAFLAMVLLPHVAAPATELGGKGVAVRPVPGGVTQQFRPPATRYGAGHRGVDLRARGGTPVHVALGGTVTFAGAVARTGWVTVNHGGGLSTTYGPVSPQLVGAGDRVPTGALIGFVAPGARHLDWGARLDGEYVDPLSLLGAWETYLTTEEDDGFAALGGWIAHGSDPQTLRAPAAGHVTSGFGPRVHPVTGAHRVHSGIDIGAPTGAPVRAAGAGTVTFAGDVTGYGRTVIVDHGGGTSTLYAHQSSLTVSIGERVNAGDLLGAVGATGTATGPHLHFEVRVAGRAVDPARWLP